MYGICKVAQKLKTIKTEIETYPFDLLCQTHERQIDEAAYELYGLTEEKKDCRGE